MSATTAAPAPTMRRRRDAKAPLRVAVDVGLAAAIAALLLTLVGMVESFSERYLLLSVFSTGQALLAIVALLAGYMAVQRAGQVEKGPMERTVAGLLAGLVVALSLAALVLLGQVINLRAVLVNASPTLYEILTFEQGTTVGLTLLVVILTALGWLGGLLYVSPRRVTRAIILGLATVMLVGLLRDIVRLVLNQYPPTRLLFRFLFTPSRGLTIPGLLTLLVVPAALRLGWDNWRPSLEGRYERMPATSQRSVRWGAYAVGGLLLLSYPFIFGRFPSEAMNNVILLGIMMGLGLNIVVGFAGMLDLGYVGFFAIGAYTMALLTSPEVGGGLTFWQALPFSVLVSIIAGVILGIPVLKMRGDYLAIVTLGFGEIIRILVLSDWLSPTFNGARGIVSIPTAVVGPWTLKDPEQLYYLLLAAVLLLWFISGRLRDSRIGRAWMAIREDEDVAEAMGINLVSTKLMAFATGAAMAGLGGAIFASKLQSIVPQTFNLLISINALSIIIIGGLASVPGVVIGALLLIGLPEILREFAEYRLWVYGALLVVMMLYKPEGFWPEETIKRELHGHDHPGLPDAATVHSDLASSVTPGTNNPVVSADGD